MATELTEDARAVVTRVLLDELVNDWLVERDETTPNELRVWAKTRADVVYTLARKLGINTAHLHLDAVYEMRSRLAAQRTEAR